MNWIALAGIAVGFGLLVIIPMIAILTEHQRKMARIVHGQRDESVEKLEGLQGVIHGTLGTREVLEELKALRKEVADLKQRVDAVPDEQMSAEAELRQHLGNS